MGIFGNLLDFFYNPKDIKKLEDKIDKDTSIETAPNRYSTFVEESIDEGLIGYSSRSEKLRTEGFLEAELCKRDTEVKASLDALIFGTLSKNFVIETAKLNDDKALELKSFIEYVLKEMDGNIYDLLLELSTAIFYGYALAEKVYKDCESGQFKGKRIIKSIKGKKQGFYSFLLDDYDNILAVNNLIQNGNDYQYLPVGKFVIFTWRKEASNPYGTAVFDAIYKFWWSKTEIIKQMLIATGKYATGSVKVKVEDNQDDALVQKGVEVMESIQSGGGVVIPPEIEVEFLQEGSKGNNPYIPILRWLDSQIALGILGNSLSINENQGRGSYAQAKIHKDITTVYSKYLERTFIEAFNEQIIRPLIEWNFDKEIYTPDYYPVACFYENFEDKKGEFLDNALKVFQLGILSQKDNDYIRENIGYPKVTKGQENASN